MVYSYEDIQQALEAIVRGEAIDEAYPVAAILGWRELFRGVIYREETWMEIATAREIMKRAKADDMYEAAIPEDDATCISEAQAIVELAEEAWAKHIRGREVEAILKIAASGEPEPQAAEPNGDMPSEAAPEKVEATPEAEAESEPVESDGPTEEASKKPPSELISGGESLTKNEPWDGYGDYRVGDVTNGLAWYQANDKDNYLDLLKHVWAFETSHKNRSRILEFVIESWKRNGGAVDEVEEESPAAEAEPETRTEAEGQAEGGEPDQEPEATEDQPADATPDTEPEARAEGEQARVDEAEPVGEDRPSGQGGAAYRKLIEIVERELKNERLDGIPEPPKEEAPTLPWKWADISADDLQNMHMQFAAYAYYKGYVRSKDERIAMHCKEAADELHNALMIKAPKYDEKGKEVKVTILEAEIAADANVKRWRKLQRKHEQLAAQAKQEQESYRNLVEALSRLHTMRRDNWEMSRK